MDVKKSRHSDEWIEQLQQTPTFGGLDSEAVRFLLDRAREQRVAGGRPVYSAGDRGDSVFVVEDGEIEVRSRGRDGRDQHWRFTRGGLFGDISLVALRPRSCFAVAARDSRLLEIDSAALHALYDHDHKQYTLLMMNMSRNFSRMLLDERGN